MRKGRNVDYEFPCGKCAKCRAVKYRDYLEIVESGFIGADCKYYFLTLTIENFARGRTHKTAKKHRVKCGCGRWHKPKAIVSGLPFDVDGGYDYEKHAFFNVYVSELWNSTISKIRSVLDDVQFVAVNELQNRLAVHKHIIIRTKRDIDPQRLNEIAHTASAMKKQLKWGKPARQDCKQIGADDGNGAARYVCKYIVKDISETDAQFSNEWGAGYKRRFEWNLRNAVARLCQENKVKNYLKRLRVFGIPTKQITVSHGWSSLKRGELQERRREFMRCGEQDVDDVEQNVQNLPPKISH